MILHDVGDATSALPTANCRVRPARSSFGHRLGKHVAGNGAQDLVRTGDVKFQNEFVSPKPYNKNDTMKAVGYYQGTLESLSKTCIRFYRKANTNIVIYNI